MTRQTRTVWVGLAHAKPLADNQIVPEALGAYVTAVGIAQDQQEFLSTVRAALKDLAFELLSLEDNRELGTQNQANDQILKLGQAAALSGKVQFNTFHTYEVAEVAGSD
jgi:hypothetical protein